jgi:hypothetical protein
MAYFKEQNFDSTHFIQGRGFFESEFGLTKAIKWAGVLKVLKILNASVAESMLKNWE